MTHDRKEYRQFQSLEEAAEKQRKSIKRLKKHNALPSDHPLLTCQVGKCPYGFSRENLYSVLGCNAACKIAHYYLEAALLPIMSVELQRSFKRSQNFPRNSRDILFTTIIYPARDFPLKELSMYNMSAIWQDIRIGLDSIMKGSQRRLLVIGRVDFEVNRWEGGDEIISINAHLIAMGMTSHEAIRSLSPRKLNSVRAIDKSVMSKTADNLGAWAYAIKNMIQGVRQQNPFNWSAPHARPSAAAELAFDIFCSRRTVGQTLFKYGFRMSRKGVKFTE